MKTKGCIIRICFCLICFLLIGCGPATKTTVKNKYVIKNNSSVVYENIYDGEDDFNNEEKESIIQDKKEDIKEEEKDESKKDIDGDKKENRNANEDEKADDKEVNNSDIERTTVVLDPGHGEGGNSGMEEQSPSSGVMKIKDPGGACGIETKVPEYEINFRVDRKLKELLEANGINVIMTRNDNSYSPGNIEKAEIGKIYV